MTSRKLDVLTGHAVTSAENAVVVELKQWSVGSIGPSTADNCVELYVGKQVRRVLHPSVQVGGYQQWLLDNHSVFYEVILPLLPMIGLGASVFDYGARHGTKAQLRRNPGKVSQSESPKGRV